MLTMVFTINLIVWFVTVYACKHGCCMSCTDSLPQGHYLGSFSSRRVSIFLK